MCVLRPTRQKLTGRQSPHRFENEPSYRPSSLEAISSSASLFAQILRWVPPVYANVAWPPQTIGLRFSTARVAKSLRDRKPIAGPEPREKTRNRVLLAALEKLIGLTEHGQ